MNSLRYEADLIELRKTRNKQLLQIKHNYLKSKIGSTDNFNITQQYLLNTEQANEKYLISKKNLFDSIFIYKGLKKKVL